MGDLKWFDPSSEHQELLDLVVATLLLGLVLEQFLAYRWSYHPRAGQGRGKPR
jgi:hypothetical protein